MTFDTALDALLYLARNALFPVAIAQLCGEHLVDQGPKLCLQSIYGLVFAARYDAFVRRKVFLSQAKKLLNALPDHLAARAQKPAAVR